MKICQQLFTAAVLSCALAESASGQSLEAFDPNVSGGTVYCSVPLPDGRVLIGGSFTSVGGVSRAKAARLLPDGSLDPSFAVNNLSGPITGIVFQPDGKMIVIGPSIVGPVARNYIHRLFPDGTLDPTFADPGANGSIEAALIQPDGKVVIGGTFDFIGTTRRTNLARLNADGTLDTSFDPAPNGQVWCLAMDSNSRLLVGGAFAAFNGVSHSKIARLDSNGTPDATFTASADFDVYSVVPQTDGKILMGGFFGTVNSVARNRMARLNADGTLDTSFNPTVSGGNVHCITLQSNGRPLIGGTFTSVGGTARNRVARLNADGTLDSTFNPNANGGVNAIALQSGGKVLLSGDFTTLGGITRNRMARFSNEAATSTMTVTGTTQIDWTRGGSAPEVERVSFDSWNGSAWISQGLATRVAGGWRLSGLSLPASTWMRGRGYATGSYHSACSAIIEQVVTYGGGTFPDVSIEQPTATVLVDGNSVVDFGTQAWTTASTAKTFFIRNTGTATLTGIAVSISGLHSSDFSATAPGATSLAPGASTTFQVTFTPTGARTRTATLLITSNDADEAGFDVLLKGSGQHLDTAFSPAIDGGQVLSTLVQPDGKIVAGGDFVTAGGSLRNRMARLNADGSLDTSFDANVNATIGTTVLFTSGKFLIGGDFTTVGGNTRNRVARLTAVGGAENGNIDANATVLCLAAQADDKSIVGGNFTTIASTLLNRVTRLPVSGSGLDSPSFNPNANSSVNSLAIQSDGKVVIGGVFSTMGGTARNHLARVTSSGALDSAFNPNPDHSFDGSFKVTCIAIQADGKMLIGGGFQTVGGIARPYLARLNADGTLDSAFTALPDNNVNTIVLQSDGKILIGGDFTQINWVDRSYIARLNADGSLDTSFDPGANAAVASIALQSDGKILVGGSFTSIGGVARNYFVRLPNNGTATQTISVSGTSQITWSRDGTAPEIEQVTFETWNGTGWTSQGAASRIAGGWRKTGLSIPAGGWARAQGRAAGGRYNGSSGLISQITTYGTAVADISVEQPVGTVLVDGVGGTTIGPVAVNSPKVVTYTVRNTGGAALTNLSVTKDGTEAADFVVGSLGATTVAAGGSTTFTVTFTPADFGLRRAAIHINSSDFDETPFDISLTGQGVTAQESWRNTFFGSTANTGNAADTFDFDRDGLVNLIEYAFGLNPALASSVALPQGQRVGNLFQISFSTPAGVSGVAYEAEWSTSLAANDWTPIADTGTPPQHVFAVTPGSNDRVFVRLKVTGQ